MNLVKTLYQRGFSETITGLQADIDKLCNAPDEYNELIEVLDQTVFKALQALFPENPFIIAVSNQDKIKEFYINNDGFNTVINDDPDIRFKDGGHIDDTFYSVGHKIKKILNTPEAYEILDSDTELSSGTWAAGACLPLAIALSKITGGQLKMIVESDTGAVQHVLVFKDGYYIDADGYQTEAGKLKIAKLEGVKQPKIIDFNKTQKGIEYLGQGSPEFIEKVVAFINDKMNFSNKNFKDGGGLYAEADKLLGFSLSEFLGPEPEEEKKPDKPNKLTDYGEKIGGAKKDLWHQLVDITEQDIISQPFSKAFPEPDYKKLVDDGLLRVEDAVLLKFIYDNIPVKPRKSYKLARWIAQVNLVIDFFKQSISSDKETNQKIFDAYKQSMIINKYLSSDYEMYEATIMAFGFPETNVKLGNFKIKKFDGWRLNSQDEKEFVTDRYSIIDGYSIVKDYETLEAAINGLKLLINVSKEKSTETKFSVYQDRKTYYYFIGKKAAVNVIRVMEPFKTAKEAFAFLKENQPQLQGIWDAMKEVQDERREHNRPRIGVDWRKGKDINTEEFAKTFGFRGVEFGNWVNNRERQDNVNEAYDALMDLSAAVNIPPDSLSLAGQLGFAFGARGSGKANAHYEPGKVVINLTKTRGSGSLAHEWWHSLDNYFSRMRGQPSNYLTESPSPTWNRQEMKVDDRVRIDMVSAYKGVVDAINNSGLPKRSMLLDRSRSKLYWSTALEMSARSFESFIIDKLAQTGQRNDYLANFKEMTEWIRDTRGNIDAETNYPYPLEQESPAIDQAYQQFFEAIKTRTNEQGIVQLFESGGYLDNLEDKMKNFDWDSLYADAIEEQKNTVPKTEDQKREEHLEELYQELGFDKKWAATFAEAKAKILAEYFSAKKTYQEWAAKDYKQNKKQVWVGDEIGGNARSIGSINEGRRQRNLNAAKYSMREAIDDLKGLGLSQQEIDKETGEKIFESGGTIPEKLYRGVEGRSNATYGGVSDDGIGVFYTDNKTMAECFAGLIEFDGDEGKYVPTGNKKGKVLEFDDIFIKNPYVIDSSHPEYEIDYDNDSVQIYFKQIRNAGNVVSYKENLQKQGYDGIILKDNTTNFYGSGTYDIYIVFDKPAFEFGGEIEKEIPETKNTGYDARVYANLQWIGTPREDWRAVPVKGFTLAEGPAGKLIDMPIFDFPKGYGHSKTLYKSSNDNQCCELCGKSPIKIVYWLQNDKEKTTLSVGSECVTHFGEGTSGKENLRQTKLTLAILLDNDLAKLGGYVKQQFSKIRDYGYGKKQREWSTSYIGNEEGFNNTRVYEALKDIDFSVLVDQKKAEELKRYTLQPEMLRDHLDTINWFTVYGKIPVFNWTNELDLIKRNYESQESGEKKLLSWFRKNEQLGRELLEKIPVLLKVLGKYDENVLNSEYLSAVNTGDGEQNNARGGSLVKRSRFTGYKGFARIGRESGNVPAIVSQPERSEKRHYWLYLGSSKEALPVESFHLRTPEGHMQKSDKFTPAAEWVSAYVNTGDGPDDFKIDTWKVSGYTIIKDDRMKIMSQKDTTQ